MTHRTQNLRSFNVDAHPVIATALANAIRSGDYSRVASVRSAISVLELRQLAEWKTSNGLPTTIENKALPTLRPQPEAAERDCASELLTSARVTASTKTTDPALREAMAHAIASGDTERIAGVEAAICAHHAQHGLLAGKDNPPPPSRHPLVPWLYLALFTFAWVALGLLIWRPWLA